MNRSAKSSQAGHDRKNSAAEGDSQNEKKRILSEKGFSLFVPRYIKECRLLEKGVRKFVRYHRDLIDTKRLDTIETLQNEFHEAAEDKTSTLDQLEDKAQKLTKYCEESVKSYQPSVMRENIEVIFVAVVIAMAIRAYFVQPFRIPTGSMEPTLNGIHAISHQDVDLKSGVDYEEPGFFKKLWDSRLGRKYVHLVAEEDGRILGIRQVNKFKFFDFTLIDVASATNPNEVRTYRVSGTLEKVQDIWNGLGLNRPVKKGEVLVHGYIDTGDQILVDKFSYHWVSPKRGDVFVFRTNGITGIETSRNFDPAYGSQHYIKRLAGTPGDHLRIEEPNLFVNGELADGDGFARVMSQEDGYRGYSNDYHFRDRKLGEKEYFALGDNSRNSSDSRYWGVVPQDNIVGKAVFVYYPFNKHWGLID